MAAGTSADYYASYEDLSVHELMLKDQARTLAYKEAIEKHAHLFKGRTVLDVGAGTGILSLFAAKNGAKQVFAVEASNMADYCCEIVRLNGFEDVVTVIKSQVETVELPVTRVDIIVSEWMGFYLLHESMLEAVLFARDKWLAETGIMLPSHATIYLAPVNMQQYCEEKFDFWKDVYGFDFSPLVKSAQQGILKQPLITHLKPGQCVAKPQVLANFKLKEVGHQDIQNLEEKFAFTLEQNCNVQGFALWFDVFFNFPADSKSEADMNHQDMTLSTSPYCEETHWKQTVCFLPTPVALQEGETIFSKVELSQDERNQRHYNISLQLLDSLEETDSEDDYDDEDDLDDVSGHPIPCNCGSGKCQLISAVMEKYDAEQTQLELEAEFDDVTAEVQAAEALDAEGLTESSYLEED